MSHTSLYPRHQVLAMTSDELITKQSHKDECDIHKILKQFKKTGIITHINTRQALYQDLPASMDYQEAIEMVRDAQSAFMELPALVREQFKNDPYQLLAALGDPARRAELEELGIVSKPPQAAPQAAPAAKTE